MNAAAPAEGRSLVECAGKAGAFSPPDARRPHVRAANARTTSRHLVAAVLGLAAALPLAAASIREDFSRDPAARGWHTRGDASLFAWNSTDARLDVTWDSSRTNSFFVLPLATILARTDDVRFACTLVLDELRTSAPDATFQLAIGFLRRADAFATNFYRGAGVNPAWGPRNVLEFDYFPASRTIAPTFSAVAVGTNNLRWAMANLFPFELTTGNRYRLDLAYTAASRTLRLAVERDGQPWCSGTTRLDDRFGDFRVDAFSVTSYSGDHQPAGYGGGLFARGWIDDLEIDHPDPPAPRLALLPATAPQAPRFAAPAVPGWSPVLERTVDWAGWDTIDPAPTGTESWTFADPNPPATRAAYRLRLERP